MCANSIRISRTRESYRYNKYKLKKKFKDAIEYLWNFKNY